MKREKFIYATMASAASIAVASLLIACGSSSSTTAVTATTTSTNYNGPGSKWDVELVSDGNFTAVRRPDVNSAVDMTVTGTYVTQSNGIIKLTVSSAVDDSNNTLSSPANGDVAWGLNAPGYAFMLRPMDSSSDQLIPMVTSGACPSSDMSGNWVNVNMQSGRLATDNSDFFGTFNFDATNQQGNLPGRYSLANPTSNLGSMALGTGSCSNGIMTISDGVMYLATNGAIVRTGTDTSGDETDDSFIFAFAQKAITDINNLDGTYGGMLFDGSNLSGQKINPVTMNCSAGSCTATQLDTDLTTTLSGGATINLNAGSGVDQPGTGFVTGTVTDGSGTGNLSCMVDIDAAGTGKKIASCVGQSPGDTSKLFNVLFVSI